MVDPGLDDTDILMCLLRPSPAGTLAHYRVSRDVGKVDNDGAYLLEPDMEAGV